jgi:hypothetical protein
MNYIAKLKLKADTAKNKVGRNRAWSGHEVTRSEKGHQHKAKFANMCHKREKSRHLHSQSSGIKSGASKLSIGSTSRTPTTSISEFAEFDSHVADKNEQGVKVQNIDTILKPAEGQHVTPEHEFDNFAYSQCDVSIVIFREAIMATVCPASTLQDVFKQSRLAGKDVSAKEL